MRISHLLYKDKEKRLKISFPISVKELNQFRKLNDFRYCKTHNCWHLPYYKESYAATQAILIESTNKSPIASNSKTVNSRAKATERYTHVGNTVQLKIKSPLDNMDISDNTEQPP